MSEIIAGQKPSGDPATQILTGDDFCLISNRLFGLPFWAVCRPISGGIGQIRGVDQIQANFFKFWGDFGQLRATLVDVGAVPASSAHEWLPSGSRASAMRCLRGARAAVERRVSRGRAAHGQRLLGTMRRAEGSHCAQDSKDAAVLVLQGTLSYRDASGREIFELGVGQCIKEWGCVRGVARRDLYRMRSSVAGPKSDQPKHVPKIGAGGWDFVGFRRRSWRR